MFQRRRRRYQRWRCQGTFFVKHLKGNGNGNLVNKMAESQATRTKVANAVVCAKAISDAKEERLWTVAGDSVLELSEKEERDNRSDVSDNE